MAEPISMHLMGAVCNHILRHFLYVLYPGNFCLHIAPVAFFTLAPSTHGQPHCIQDVTSAFCGPSPSTPVCSRAFKGHVWRGVVQQPFSGECGRHPYPCRLAQCRAAQSTSHRFYQQASIAEKKTSSDKFLLPFLFTSPECLPFYLLAIGAVSWDSWAVKMERTGIASM